MALSGQTGQNQKLLRRGFSPGVLEAFDNLINLWPVPPKVPQFTHVHPPQESCWQTCRSTGDHLV